MDLLDLTSRAGRRSDTPRPFNAPPSPTTGPPVPPATPPTPSPFSPSPTTFPIPLSPSPFIFRFPPFPPPPLPPPPPPPPLAPPRSTAWQTSPALAVSELINSQSPSLTVLEHLPEQRPEHKSYVWRLAFGNATIHPGPLPPAGSPERRTLVGTLEEALVTQHQMSSIAVGIAKSGPDPSAADYCVVLSLRPPTSCPAAAAFIEGLSITHELTFKLGPDHLVSVPAADHGASRDSGARRLLLQHLDPCASVVGLPRALLSCAGYDPKEVPILSARLGRAKLGFDPGLPCGLGDSTTVVSYVRPPADDPHLRKLPTSFVDPWGGKVSVLMDRDALHPRGLHVPTAPPPSPPLPTPSLSAVGGQTSNLGAPHEPPPPHLPIGAMTAAGAAVAGGGEVAGTPSAGGAGVGARTAVPAAAAARARVRLGLNRTVGEGLPSQEEVEAAAFTFETYYPTATAPAGRVAIMATPARNLPGDAPALAGGGWRQAAFPVGKVRRIAAPVEDGLQQRAAAPAEGGLQQRVGPPAEGGSQQAAAQAGGRLRRAAAQAEGAAGAAAGAAAPWAAVVAAGAAAGRASFAEVGGCSAAAAGGAAAGEGDSGAGAGAGGTAAAAAAAAAPRPPAIKRGRPAKTVRPPLPYQPLLLCAAPPPPGRHTEPPPRDQHTDALRQLPHPRLSPPADPIPQLLLSVGAGLQPVAALPAPGATVCGSLALLGLEPATEPMEADEGSGTSVEHMEAEMALQAQPAGGAEAAAIEQGPHPEAAEAGGPEPPEAHMWEAATAGLGAGEQAAAGEPIAGAALMAGEGGGASVGHMEGEMALMTLQAQPGADPVAAEPWFDPYAAEVEGPFFVEGPEPPEVQLHGAAAVGPNAAEHAAAGEPVPRCTRARGSAAALAAAAPAPPHRDADFHVGRLGLALGATFISGGLAGSSRGPMDLQEGPCRAAAAAATVPEVASWAQHSPPAAALAEAWMLRQGRMEGQEDADGFAVSEPPDSRQTWAAVEEKWQPSGSQRSGGDRRGLGFGAGAQSSPGGIALHDFISQERLLYPQQQQQHMPSVSVIATYLRQRDGRFWRSRSSGDTLCSEAQLRVRLYVRDLAGAVGQPLPQGLSGTSGGGIGQEAEGPLSRPAADIAALPMLHPAPSFHAAPPPPSIGGRHDSFYPPSPTFVCHPDRSGRGCSPPEAGPPQLRRSPIARGTPAGGGGRT